MGSISSARKRLQRRTSIFRVEEEEALAQESDNTKLKRRLMRTRRVETFLKKYLITTIICQGKEPLRTKSPPTRRYCKD
jgi:hypothetical protein